MSHLFTLIRGLSRSLAALIAVPLVVVLLQTSAVADETPMTYIEFRMIATWIKPDSFNAVTRKLWRHENGRLRMEEPRNPDNGAEMTMIANLPDAWMVDRAKKVGRHFVDPGPTFNVIFPVFQAGAPASLRGLQMGRELAYFKEQTDVERGEATLEGAACDTYTATIDNAEVRLWVDKASGHPRQVSLKTEKIAYSVRYEAYKSDVALDAKLFALPDGIEVTEPK